MKGSKQKQPQRVKILYKNVLSRRCYQIFKGNKTQKHEKAFLKMIKKKKNLTKETGETQAKKIKLDKERLLKIP